MLTLRNWIKEFYIGLLRDGWKLNDIEEIDLLWYIDLINYQENKEYEDAVDTVLDIL